MRLKPGVRIFGLRPETLFAMCVASKLLEVEGHTFVVTCGSEGQHMRGSLHYAGLAFDFRRPDLTWVGGDLLRSELAKRLGDDFDVVQESNHFHVEFQPKTPYV